MTGARATRNRPGQSGRISRQTGPVDAALGERVERLDWAMIETALGEQGHAVTPPLLNAGECGELARLYADAARFRSRVDMEHHGFGVGEYQYFAEPLPGLVAALRQHAYRHLAPVANRWMERLSATERFPDDLAAFLARCARAGQTKPTPLLLSYRAGGYNCLHQDLYGAVAFPLQLTCLLSRPGVDFTGGEFLLVEQRPRAQSRGEVVTLERGQAVIFATRYRPVAGTHGYYRTQMRHGVSRLHRGTRLTLGIIFHDAA